MSGLNGGICIFYKPGVICIPGCRDLPRPVYHDEDRRLRWHTCAEQIPVVDLSPVRIALAGAVSDQAAIRAVNSPIYYPRRHRYADEYRHEFN